MGAYSRLIAIEALNKSERQGLISNKSPGTVQQQSAMHSYELSFHMLSLLYLQCFSSGNSLSDFKLNDLF